MELFFLSTMFVGCITIIFLCVYVIKTLINEPDEFDTEEHKEISYWSQDLYTDYNRWNNCRNIDDRWL